MGLHFVLCSMEKSEKHSHSECIGLHFNILSTVILMYLFFYFLVFEEVLQIMQNCLQSSKIQWKNPLAFCQGNPGRRSLPGWPTHVIPPLLYTVKTHVQVE